MRGPLLQESLTHVMCCGIARVETSRCRTAGREQTERQANRVYQARQAAWWWSRGGVASRGCNSGNQGSDRPNRCNSSWSGHLRIRDCPAEIQPCSFFLQRSRAAAQRTKEGREKKEKDQGKGRRGCHSLQPGRKTCGSNGRLSSKPPSSFLCLLCFSGHCRQDTAQDKVEGPVLCVLGAWDAVERGKDPGLGISRV